MWKANIMIISVFSITHYICYPFSLLQLLDAFEWCVCYLSKLFLSCNTNLTIHHILIVGLKNECMWGVWERVCLCVYKILVKKIPSKVLLFSHIWQSFSGQPVFCPHSSTLILTGIWTWTSESYFSFLSEKDSK